MVAETSKGQSASAPQASPAKSAPSAASPAAAGAQEVPQISFRGLPQPIVIRLKKKKRRYSSSLKTIQRRMRSSTKVTDRVLDAISSGLGKYRKRADRSSKKKKDGILKDFVNNSAAGLGATLRKSSKLPELIAKSMRSQKSSRRQVNVIKALVRGRS